MGKVSFFHLIFDKRFGTVFSLCLEKEYSCVENIPELKDFESETDSVEGSLSDRFSICSVIQKETQEEPSGRNLGSFSHVDTSLECYGCLYDRPGQRDHMECPSGCLHSPQYCGECS